MSRFLGFTGLVVRLSVVSFQRVFESFKALGCLRVSRV